MGAVTSALFRLFSLREQIHSAVSRNNPFTGCCSVHSPVHRSAHIADSQLHTRILDAGRMYKRRYVGVKERVTLMTGQCIAVVTICLLLIPAMLSFPIPPPTQLTNSPHTSSSTGSDITIIPVTASCPAPRPTRQTISAYMDIPGMPFALYSTTLSNITTPISTTTSYRMDTHSCPAVSSRVHTMTPNKNMPVSCLTVAKNIDFCPITQPIAKELTNTTMIMIDHHTNQTARTTYHQYQHHNKHGHLDDDNRQHLGPNIASSLSRKCHQALEWCYFQHMESSKQFHLDLRWPGNHGQLLPFSTFCWIATLCLPWTVFSFVAVATPAALTIGAFLCGLCSAVAFAAVGYFMLAIALCSAVIWVLLGEMTCRTLDHCIPLGRRLRPLSRMYYGLLISSSAAMTVIGVFIACYSTMCVLAVEAGSELFRIVGKAICCGSRREDRLSRMYYGLVISSSAAMTGIGVFVACYSTICVFAVEAGSQLFRLAVKPIWCGSRREEHQEQSALSDTEMKLAALKLQKRADRHKNKKQRSRGIQWVREHFNDSHHAPLTVHVSIQHPDLGPFRLETTVPVSQTIQEFCQTTGLSNAIVRTADSHKVLTPSNTFEDYGCLPGSVIYLRTTIMADDDGLLVGSTCEFVKQSGTACGEPSVDGVHCRHHAHPLRSIMELGHECDRLKMFVTLVDMHAKASVLLDRLNVMPAPDEPMALSESMSTLEPFHRLREFRRAQLVHALQIGEGTQL
jgi:hypothetical protein